MKTKNTLLIILALILVGGALYLIFFRPTDNIEKEEVNYFDNLSEVGVDIEEENIPEETTSVSVQIEQQSFDEEVVEDDVPANNESLNNLDEFIREEHADYFMTHPIQIGINAGTTQEKEMFYDIPRYILLCLDYDDYVHEIPFFYEDLGIKKDVWWIYDGKKVEPLNSADDEYTFYFYYTTDYDLIEEFRENHNVSALDTMGKIEIFYSDWELKFLFRETRKEGKDQKTNYQAEWIER